MKWSEQGCWAPRLRLRETRDRDRQIFEYVAQQVDAGETIASVVRDLMHAGLTAMSRPDRRTEVRPAPSRAHVSPQRTAKADWQPPATEFEVR